MVLTDSCIEFVTCFMDFSTMMTWVRARIGGGGGGNGSGGGFGFSQYDQEDAVFSVRKELRESAQYRSGDNFLRMMENVYKHISKLLDSDLAADNLLALRNVVELIDMSLGDSAVIVSKVSEYMCKVFDRKHDHEVYIRASKVLGHLARVGGALAADEVDRQISKALKWLREDRVEDHRFVAVLILKETADNAATVFNVHISEFVHDIWVAFRDPVLAVRQSAVDALRACLGVMEKRETRWRVLWYYQMFENSQHGLVKDAPVYSIHGSLLAVGELLRNSGEFMMSRYREVSEMVMTYLDHRDRLVRQSITALLPRIAHFLRDRFVTNYLEISMKHVLEALTKPAECGVAFIALGELAVPLDQNLLKYLPKFLPHLCDAIARRKGHKSSVEALSCVGSFAKVMGPVVEHHIRSLLDVMYSSGLSPTLVETLEQISISIPSLLPTIQQRLFDTILAALSVPQTSPGVVRGSTINNPPQVSEFSGSTLVQLALQTLAYINFKDLELLDFARTSVIVFLENEDVGIRRDAAICCCRLVVKTFSGAQVNLSRSSRAGVKRRHLVEEIVDKLLTAAIADADVGVRLSVFSSLHGHKGFDGFLEQVECLSAIFVALNDEDFDVREFAVSLAGRLSERNPAYVLPALRRHLIRLLTYLDQSADLKCKEDSARLLGCLIRNCERLIHPYVDPIHKALVTKLGAGANANSGVESGVLVTIGDLAKVGGFKMRGYLPKLMPLIFEALLDRASVTKREMAIATLGRVAQSTGYVISPYTEYPQLLGLLLRMLNGELAWSTRREALKVLGIIGALDPHVHRRNQQNILGSHGEINCGTVNDVGQHLQSVDELPADIWPSFSTSEDYYPMVAINTLMRILRDPSLSSYHQKVVSSLMFIFESMGLGCVLYLPKVLPDLFLVVRTCEDCLKEFIIWKLGSLVSNIRQHIRKYLPDLLSLISEQWSFCGLSTTNRLTHGSPILYLVKQLCLALNDEFKAYLPVILPCCLQMLSEAEHCKYVLDILHTFEVFGGTLDEHMHLLLPALIRLFKANASAVIKRAAIQTLTKLIPCMQVSGHVSVLVHQLMTILDGKNDDFRKDAMDALCALVHVLGVESIKFLPSIHKIMLKHRLRHKEFEEIEARLQGRGPIVIRDSVLKTIRRQSAVVVNDPIIDMEIGQYGEGTEMPSQTRSHKVNDEKLQTAGEASQRSTKEDWAEWMRHFTIELLRESPSPSLRTCAGLAQLQPFVGRELFAAGFVSCWTQLTKDSQHNLVKCLELAFSAPHIPPEILATLLNLAEFMEHDEKPLPIDIRLLGALAEKCRAFAKALHYKEMEFEGADSNTKDVVSVVEALIHINNQLHQHEAAVGILTYAQEELDVELKESWYEKLQRWEDALKAYTVKASQASSLTATLGRMRCLAALARWEELNSICIAYWIDPESTDLREIAPIAASAAWNMGEWDQMSDYVSKLVDDDDTKLRTQANTAATGDGSSNGSFFKAVLFVHRGKYDEARGCIEKARNCLATELAALVLESYDRAYSNMVRVQQLSELEEVIDYCTLPVGDKIAEGRRVLIRNMWSDRIQGTKRNVEVWQALLAVRRLVLPPTEDVDTWLKFSSLCRKSGRISQARATLVKLLQYDPELSGRQLSYDGPPQVILGYLKYQWSLGEDMKRKEAYFRLKQLSISLSRAESRTHTAASSISHVSLRARIYHKLGTWQWALSPELDDDSIDEILMALRNATECAAGWAKAWHTWALFNATVLTYKTIRGLTDVDEQYVVGAVNGYFNSIAYSARAKGVDDSLQDILRLLTLWFNFGATREVQRALTEGFSHVNIDTWLAVIPQIIARIHSNTQVVRESIQSLLVRIGRGHPQALIYPLLVACKSVSPYRRSAAQEVVDSIRQHTGALVDQAHLVSKELIRVSILWHEMWHEALEEASRLYFGDRNIEGMLTLLEPLHKIIEEGPLTLSEHNFIQAYHHELREAYACCMKYKRTLKDGDITQAWDIYYHVFRRIDKQLPTLATLELQTVSTQLLECKNLELAVPGTYRAGSPVVTIGSFAPQLTVMASKQRPRRLTIYGSDGEEYPFLLKGHEDLRQDERVMQLFGLINTLLANSRETGEKDLSIQRYAVIPLAPNSGLIEWVPNCDTLHYLIREYRDARKITLNQEHKLMLAFAPNFDHLPLIAKVEVFEHALQNTEGNDLSRILWLKNRTSEVWLERRTNYSRSLAVMSMVGYLLGLGDRHPSNLMLHRYSGKILHIDFGDCFEASINREKFPEKVPFRLTRMLIKAMELSGVEGNFRTTCENVMEVLRRNKDSVMAMMEAFVHDPLVNWRLFNLNDVPQMSNLVNSQPIVDGEEPSSLDEEQLPQPQRGVREKELLQAITQLGDAKDVLNERAVVVMARMNNKLTGKDFGTAISSSGPNSSHLQTVDPCTLLSADSREVEQGLSVKLQVQKLIEQARSHENLCQNYIGWCPFW